MGEPFIGSEAVAAGTLIKKSALRSQYQAIPGRLRQSGRRTDAALRAHAGWLWSRRRGVVAGLSAAALHGSKWIDATRDRGHLLHGNRHSCRPKIMAVIALSEDEIAVVDGVPVTTPAPNRTRSRMLVSDRRSGRCHRRTRSCRLTSKFPTLSCSRSVIRAARHHGAAPCARILLMLGAQSPKETWLRLVLVDAGLPRPQTQIPVHDDFGDVIAYLDMGWEGIKVAVEYDGDQHRNDRRQYNWDIRRLESLERLGWTVVRVVAGDRPADIVRRVRSALARRA